MLIYGRQSVNCVIWIIHSKDRKFCGIIAVALTIVASGPSSPRLPRAPGCPGDPFKEESKTVGEGN